MSSSRVSCTLCGRSDPPPTVPTAGGWLVHASCAEKVPAVVHPGHVLGWRETRRVCVSRGPAFGIGFALPWSLVMWAATGIVAAMVIG